MLQSSQFQVRFVELSLCDTLYYHLVLDELLYYWKKGIEQSIKIFLENISKQGVIDVFGLVNSASNIFLFIFSFLWKFSLFSWHFSHYLFAFSKLRKVVFRVDLEDTQI